MAIDVESDATWRRWREVDRLLDQALDRPPAERERFLAGACRGDLELFRAVAGLLRALDASEGRFEGPGADVLEAALTGGSDLCGASDAAVLSPGDRVGRWRILGEIGRGGMATVYEAERMDGSFHRRVAVKVLRRGLDTDEVVRRFLGERQILSQLSHPNIARLIDGGALADGRPYLVMERVEGVPLTRWADERGLSVEARLDLFLQLVDAVQFAHRRLVVHRDLKPSNVLVDAEGRAHLLDFGIAKLLDAEPGGETLTRVGSPRPLTPGFASPEQLRGEPVTTASDVYQLGVLLHLLLTGRRPPGAGGAAEGEPTASVRPSEVVRRPPSPGSGADRGEGDLPPEEVARRRGTTLPGLRRALRGDLDTIVLTALRAEPEQRYPSAEALAGDVRRHLSGRPVTARPPSIRYRLGKFLRRNPWVGPLAAALILAAGTYLFTVVRHARELERERNAAQAEAERADELRSFVVDLFRAADPYETPDPGRSREMTVVEALEVGAERVRADLDGRPVLQAAMLTTIADVYENMALHDLAVPLVDEALRIHERAGTRDSPDYLDAFGARARLTASTLDRDSAGVLLDRWVEMEEGRGEPDLRRLAEAVARRADNEVHRGRYREALEGRERAVRLYRAAGAAGRDDLGGALAMLSDSYRNLDRFADAEAAAREAVAIEEELWGPEHPSTAIQRVHLAQVFHERNLLAEAAAEYRKALPVLERTLGPEHYNTMNSWNNLAIVLSDQGDLAGSEAVHRRILALRRGPAGDARTMDVAGSLQNLAASLLRAGRHAEADSLSREAYTIYRDLAPRGSHLPALPLLTQAEIRLSAGDAPGAEEVSRRAIEILRPALPDGHYATAVAECRLGISLARQGQPEEATPLVEDAREALRSWRGTPERFLEECDSGAEELTALRSSG